MDPARRGTDWLDGALAGWLMVSAVQAAGRGGAPGWLAAIALAGAVVPYLRFLRAGWVLAAAGLALHALGELSRAGEGGVRPVAALLPHLLALGYLAWVRPGFFAGSSPAPGPAVPEPASSAEAALAAIHRRISAAGSACEVGKEEVREEAERHGLDLHSLSTEGVALYRTFLTHFLAAGPLGAAQEHELACVGRLLRIDSQVLSAARAEAGAGEAMPVDAGVPLSGGEVCLAARTVELYRIPAGREGETGDGPEPIRHARDLAGHTRAGSCRFLVTDRRLVLVAPSGQQSPLPLERVVRTVAYANGLEVRPARGPALFLRFEDGVEEVSRLLAAARRTSPTIHPPPDST